MFDSTKIFDCIVSHHHDKSDGVERETRGGKLNIVVTQPRRVAAISMTKRICHERGVVEYTDEVSYAIRFDDRTTDKTRIRYVTDGILVRECISV